MLTYYLCIPAVFSPEELTCNKRMKIPPVNYLLLFQKKNYRDNEVKLQSLKKPPFPAEPDLEKKRSKMSN